MNIWIFNPFDELPGEGPEGRFACISRHLSARGHWVTWVTADFHHRLKRKRHAPGPSPYEILLIPAPAYSKNTSMQRLHSHGVWARNVRAHLLQEVKSGALPSPDLILASTPPVEGAAAAIQLGKVLHAKVIIDVMDRWPENWLPLLPKLPGIRVLGRLLLTPWFRLSRKVFREADALSAQSQAFGEFALGKRSEGRGQRFGQEGEGANGDGSATLRSRRGEGGQEVPAHPPQADTEIRAPLCDTPLPLGGELAETPTPHSKPHICHLGASAAPEAKKGSTRELCAFDIHSLAVDKSAQLHGLTPFADLNPLTSDLSILYLGAMGRFYDIGTVLRAMGIAKREGRSWRLTLAGTDPNGQWQSKAAKLGLADTVRFPGFVQAGELNELLQSAHMGLIPMDPASKVAIPYKAGDYLAHGLPVLSSLPGELETLLTESGAGLNYRFGDAEDLYAQLSRFADEPDALAKARAAARNLFRDHFDREITYPQWAEWIEAVAAFPGDA